MDKPAQELSAHTTPDEQPGVRRLTPTSPARARTKSETAAATLTSIAMGLGIVRVGIARPDPDVRADSYVTRWLEHGYHGTMTFMEAPRQDPEHLLPGVRSVIVAAIPTETPDTPQHTNGYVAAYARGADYHTVFKHKLWQLGQALCDFEDRPIRARVCVDTAPILEREWARRAGVTFTGKSAMAIAPGVGTTILLGLLLTDVELAPSTPLPDGCGACTRCLDACPTQAFPAPLVLDARRCIAYLTIEHSEDISPELHPQMGTHVFGCDVCQQVCPYNASRKRPPALAELAALPARRSPDLVSWLRMTSGDYRRLTRESALRRTSRTRLQRNAAIALGNALTDPAQASDAGFAAEAVAALREALLQHPSAQVRKHAACSLGRVAHAVRDTVHAPPAAQTNPALDALKLALEHEADPTVLHQVRRALQPEPSVDG